MGPLVWNLRDVEAGFCRILTWKEPGLTFPSQSRLNFVIWETMLGGALIWQLVSTVSNLLPSKSHFSQAFSPAHRKIVQEFNFHTIALPIIVLLPSTSVSESGKFVTASCQFFSALHNGTN